MNMIVLFQHGYASDASAFEQMINNILSFDHNMVLLNPIQINKFNLEKFKSEYLLNRGKIFLIATEFSNSIADNQLQMKQLNDLMQKIKIILPQETFILVGHSKGGLVNMETYFLNPNWVEKIISISTPYCVNKYADAFSNLLEALDKKGLLKGNDHFDGIKNLGSQEYLSSLRNKWNSTGDKKKLFLIAGISSKIKKIIYFDRNVEVVRIYSDGVVRLEEQLGILNEKALSLNVMERNVMIFDSVAKESILIENENSFSNKNIMHRIRRFKSNKIDHLFQDLNSLRDFSKPYHHLNILNQIEVARYIYGLIRLDV